MANFKELCETAYSGFNAKQTAPLINLSENWKVLELFHGPTLAFKKFALQLLGNLYGANRTRTTTLCILEPHRGILERLPYPDLKTGCYRFYPISKGKVFHYRNANDENRASNVYPIAIEGTFDDAQRTVKELFA